MSDPNVGRWKQRGRVCVWKHKWRHVDWNIAADLPGCDTLLELVDLLQMARWPSHATVTLVKTQQTATGFSSPAVFANRFVLKACKDDLAEDHWSLQATADELMLVTGKARLDEFRRAILEMRRGEGDCSIGAKQAPLWIWWFVD